MPGMSARIKAKKGRYGANGLPPSVQITSPATGFTVAAAGSPVATGDFTLRGKAFDDLAGDVSANIVWSSDIDGTLGTAATLPVQLSAGGSPTTVHVITATISAGAGSPQDTATDTITVTVT